MQPPKHASGLNRLEAPSAQTGQSRIGRGVSCLLGVACAISLVLMALLMVVDVFFRYVLNSPIGSAFELIQVLLAVLIFSGVAMVSLRGKHVTMDLLFEGERFVHVRRFLDTISSVIAMVAFAILAVRLVVYGNYMKMVGEQTMFLQIPIYPFVYLAAVACAISALAYGLRLVAMLRKARGDAV